MIKKLKNNNNDSVGILGSGLMGHGIAYAAAISGLEVLMLDLTKNQADKGLQKIYQILMTICLWYYSCTASVGLIQF